jgi:presenilin-like A22 family membrane protease
MIIRLESSNNDVSEKSSSFPKTFSLLMIGLPFASLIFPEFLQLAKSFTPNSSEQFAVVTAMFVSSRVYLYALSATILGLSAVRGATDRPQLGQRITDLTEELLYRPSLLLEAREKRQQDDDDEEKPAVIQSMASSGFGESLDQVSTETQALFLPLLVSALLATSIFLLPVWNGPSGVNVAVEDEALLATIQELVSQLVQTVSQVWNVGLLALFTRSEVRRLGSELEIGGVVDSFVVEWIVAIGITGLAFFLQLWPAQNFVNMALAILVARAIQLDKFPAIVAALSLLTLYDATSVLFIPAANAIMDDVASSASSPTTTAAGMLLADASASSPASASAMGSLAIQKLTSGSFQPGLLVSKIGDRMGGALGLGDAVFPSLLVNFVRRFDLETNDNIDEEQQRLSLFAVSIAGYLLGCFACEFSPTISTSGLPALVFIIPSMLGSVIVASAVSGELTDLWNFDPKTTGLDDEPTMGDNNTT